jgi:RTX calcium-binding nonapeptide repeat (4 copies)
MSLIKRTSILPILVCAALLTAATVGAATITGTAGNDTLRGGAKADKLTGKGGNDKLYGLAGNDVLAGGAGNDLLVGGPGADRLSCGAGQDTARGDAQDTIGSDCEVVKGVPSPSPTPAPAPQPPPAPAPPPVSPVTPGSYQGQTQNGNFVFLTVLPNRTFTKMRVNDLPAECDSGGYLPGGEDFGDSILRIRDDGTFAETGNWDGSIVGGDVEFTHWDGRIAGRFDTATTVSGTIVMNYGLKYQGTPIRCSSGEIKWTATLRS